MLFFCVHECDSNIVISKKTLERVWNVQKKRRALRREGRLIREDKEPTRLPMP